MAIALLLGGGLALDAQDSNGKARRRAAYPDTLPAGGGQVIAAQSCGSCHSAMIIAQQAKDSTGWEKTVAQMEKWGAPIGGRDERDTLMAYLRAAFPPRAARAAK